MSDGSDRPHIRDELKRWKLIFKYLAVYAVIALSISAIFDDKWVSIILLCGFVAIGGGYMNNLFVDASYEPRNNAVKKQEDAEDEKQ